MNLVESVRRWVIANLPYNHSDTDIVGALNEKNAHGLLVTYHNWMSRLVQPIPRQIEYSVAFRANPYRETFSDALAAIEQDVRAGNDLTKYLSKGVRVALKLPGRRRGASDLDMLLNDWGVHHLHLAVEIQADGFVQRTGPLLFARFVRDTAYFLDIADHGEWTKESVAEALVNEFPDAGGVHVVRGVVGVSREYTDEEHHRLRVAGVNTIRMIGDKAVVGGGFNTMGHSVMAVQEADRVLAGIEQFEAYWRNDESSARAHWEEQCGRLPDAPMFEFTISESGPAIVELKSRTGLRLE